MNADTHWFARNSIAIYFSIISLVAGFALYDEYVHLNKVKTDLTEFKRSTSEIYSHFNVLKSSLLDRIARYEESVKGEVTWQKDENIRLRIIEIDKAIKQDAFRNNIPSPKTCLPAHTNIIKDCTHIIEIELLTQEINYLTALHALVMARYNFEQSFAKDKSLRNSHEQVYTKLQENIQKHQKQSKIPLNAFRAFIPFTASFVLRQEKLKLIVDNRNAAESVELNSQVIETERTKILQSQSSSFKFGLQEAKIQNLLSPLYAHIHDTRQHIDSHWIFQIFKPIFGNIPLLVFIIFVVTLFGIIVQFGFRVIDRRIMPDADNPNHLNKMVIAMIVLCSIPVLSISAITWQEQAERAKAVSILKSKIDNAKPDFEKAIQLRTDELAQFIKSRKIGVKKFSQEMLSFKGKWKVITGSEHKRFVEEQFGKDIFTPDELSAHIKYAVESSLRDIEGIENELVVSLNQDITARKASINDIVTPNYEINISMSGVIVASKQGAIDSAVIAVASELSTNISVQVMTRLAVSSSILTASTVASPWTLGASVVLGIAVDSLWNLIADPTGKLESEINQSLDSLSTKSTTTVHDEIMKIVEQHNKQLKDYMDGKLL